MFISNNSGPEGLVANPRTKSNKIGSFNTDTLSEMEDIGDGHVGTNMETPMRDDAFVLSDEEKIRVIESHFRKIMDTLGLDLNDDSLKGTPYRVAKMYVKEVFNGLDPKNKPQVKVFENKYQYNDMLVEKNITVRSFCEHHFLPISGKAHVAYMSSGTVIGLSKINRIVDYFSRRPQVQERLTRQIVNELKRVLKTEDVAIVLEASHLCVSFRGIKDEQSSTVTSEFSGKFREEAVKNEFLQHIGKK